MCMLSPHDYNPAAPKRPTNVSLNQDLVRVAKAYGINVSRIAEAALAEAVRARTQEDWLNNNAEALDAYNEQIGRRGVFSDGHRRFGQHFTRTRSERPVQSPETPIMRAHLFGCAPGAAVPRHMPQAHRTSPSLEGVGALGAPGFREAHLRRCEMGADEVVR